VALHTIGTKASSSLVSLPAWSAAIAAADVAAVASNILSDSGEGAILGGGSAGQTYFIGTGNTHTNTTLDTLATSAGPDVSTIMVGDVVLGAGIPAGTYVTAISSTTATLSQAATATASGVNVIIAHPRALAPRIDIASAQLFVPNRGTLVILPGDYVAVGKAGEVVIVPGNAVSYAGSVWTFT
jgi:hypothetical protein